MPSDMDWADEKAAAIAVAQAEETWMPVLNFPADAIAAALREAHEAGRRAGLAEAAQIVHASRGEVSDLREVVARIQLHALAQEPSDDGA